MTEKIEEQKFTPEQFFEAYQNLCQRMGFRVIAEPAWLPTNHSTFELILNYKVVETPKDMR